MTNSSKRLCLFAVLGLCASSYGTGINAAPGFSPADTSSTYQGGPNKQLANITAPFGSFSDKNVGFAAWEKFTETRTQNPEDPDDVISNAVFSNAKKQYWSGGVGLNVSLSQSNANCNVAKETSNFGYQQIDGVDYYGRLTGEFDFTISGTADQATSSLVLQIKHSPYLDSNWDRIIPFTAELTFGDLTLTASGVEGPEAPNFSDPLSLPIRTFVYEYRWDNLNLDALSEFSIAFSGMTAMPGEVAPMGLVVDTIALHAYAVPEPATYALLMVAATALLAARRHRKRRQE